MPPTISTTDTRVGIVLCAGCCCGRTDPEGAAPLRALCQASPDLARVRTSSCLGRCDYSDVVVVQPSLTGRRRGGRPVWFGCADVQTAARIRDWVAEGGPGVALLPRDLALHKISAPGADAPRAL
ncbi:(2Fe-2S) ferredoxin domain-containing protein [Micromonospora sp. WMMD975]|uniref:(2Fe-2S) ferredoxin domain-containing protein n=1 Tax=Micromonospora sp. WMMD975 TaxID=3016087 RepID=UPI00249CE19F|nr:(2Fe-2S) ferredoxin domain-containing protein [Micromonospora sp. WMMD975]WFE30934.1 (2Fe-2S) ferredoxin domain-containing protein [Micromonospora sp. WMMD975]